MAKTDFCALQSQQRREPLLGTAPRVDFWFALEYPYPFEKRASKENRLPPAVQDHLCRGLAALPHARLQLIRKGRRFSGEGIAFFVTVCHEEAPNLYEFRLSAYEDLLSLDLADLASEKREYRPHDRQGPLYLVCTNGRRDPCCARWGFPLFQDLKKAAPGGAWQTAHVGGHRFAPNVVVLPQGVYYGWVTPEDIPDLLQHQTRHRVWLEKYRGRTCYDAHVQAAEAFLRQQTGGRSFGAFKLIEIETLPGDQWIFHFKEPANGRSHCLQVQRRLSDFEIQKSCRDPSLSRVPQYDLVDYQTRAPLKKDFVG